MITRSWIYAMVGLAGLLAGCSNGTAPSDDNAGAPQPAANSNDAAFAPASEQPAVTESTGGSDSIIPEPPPAVQKAKEEQAKKDGDDQASTSPKDAAAAAEVELKPIDMAGYEKFIKDNAGKVVAVDCWASWCHPCREKFPKFIELAKKCEGKPVQFVSLSFDFEDETDQVMQFLREQNAVYTNFRMTEEQTKFEDSHGYEGIPRYLVYDKTGALVANTDDVEAAKAKVQELLGS